MSPLASAPAKKPAEKETEFTYSMTTAFNPTTPLTFFSGLNSLGYKYQTMEKNKLITNPDSGRSSESTFDRTDATGKRYHVTFSLTQFSDNTFRLDIKTNDKDILRKMEAFDVLNSRMPVFKVQSGFFSMEEGEKVVVSSDQIEKELSKLGYKLLSVDNIGYETHSYRTYKRGTDKYAVIDTETFYNDRNRLVGLYLRTNDPLLLGLGAEMIAEKKRIVRPE